MTDVPFWKRKTLEEMTRKEWESLCDGCAKCCLVKLEDEDTEVIEFTDAACKLLDLGTCRVSGRQPAKVRRRSRYRSSSSGASSPATVSGERMGRSTFPSS